MDCKNNRTPQPQEEIARILVEFLEVAITSVVFLKGVYPNGAFERRRYMNVVVHKARHPQLNEYIHSAVYGLLPFVEKGLVERVAVIFFDDGDVPIEKFVFKLNVNQSYPSTVEQVDLEFSLRSFLIKLPVSEALTKTLPRRLQVGNHRLLPITAQRRCRDVDPDGYEAVATTVTDNTNQVHDQ
ncbi:DNA polymerase zeta processivity subunit [Orobanche gracilis]